MCLCMRVRQLGRYRAIAIEHASTDSVRRTYAVPPRSSCTHLHAHTTRARAHTRRDCRMHRTRTHRSHTHTPPHIRAQRRGRVRLQPPPSKLPLPSPSLSPPLPFSPRSSSTARPCPTSTVGPLLAAMPTVRRRPPSWPMHSTRVASARTIERAHCTAQYDMCVRWAQRAG